MMNRNANKRLIKKLLVKGSKKHELLVQVIMVYSAILSFIIFLRYTMGFKYLYDMCPVIGSFIAIFYMIVYLGALVIFIMLFKDNAIISIFMIIFIILVIFVSILSSIDSRLLLSHELNWIILFNGLFLIFFDIVVSFFIAIKYEKIRLLFLALLLPLLIASAFSCLFMIKAKEIENGQEKVRAVAWYVYSTTLHSRKAALGNLFRSYNDICKFLIVGVAGCDFMAKYEVVLLKLLGYNARMIEFPGEDHAFVEVYVNGSWMVSDPGYKALHLVTRENRARVRLKEFGAISYVCTVEDNQNVELTDKYVSTDTIVIRVLKDGKPLVGAKVKLVHKFRGVSMKIPCVPVYTDEDGIVVLKLGALNYSSNAEPVEKFFLVYINDKQTGLKITSTGSGKTVYYNVTIDN